MKKRGVCVILTAVLLLSLMSFGVQGSIVNLVTNGDFSIVGEGNDVVPSWNPYITTPAVVEGTDYYIDNGALKIIPKAGNNTVCGVYQSVPLTAGVTYVFSYHVWCEAPLVTPLNTSPFALKIGSETRGMLFSAGVYDKVVQVFYIPAETRNYSIYFYTTGKNESDICWVDDICISERPANGFVGEKGNYIDTASPNEIIEPTAYIMPEDGETSKDYTYMVVKYHTQDSALYIDGIYMEKGTVTKETRLPVGPVSGIDLQVPDDGIQYIYKAFVWESMETMKPLTDACSVSMITGD